MKDIEEIIKDFNNTYKEAYWVALDDLFNSFAYNARNPEIYFDIDDMVFRLQINKTAKEIKDEYGDCMKYICKPIIDISVITVRQLLMLRTALKHEQEELLTKITNDVFEKFSKTDKYYELIAQIKMIVEQKAKADEAIKIAKEKQAKRQIKRTACKIEQITDNIVKVDTNDFKQLFKTLKETVNELEKIFEIVIKK